jgi:phosphorylase kinase alpha/beta subunit
MDFVKRSYEILDSLRLPHGLYLASSSKDYEYVWLRDSFYEVLPYLYTDCDRYEKTYHCILDLFKRYEARVDRCIQHKPNLPNEYFHIRFEATAVSEIDMLWGNAQHDAIGAVLFGISEGERVGKRIVRDEGDLIILQKMVKYLESIRYWMDADNGMWEEWREVRSSSVGACVAALKGLREQNLADVPMDLIKRGMRTLDNHFPLESADRPYDMAQLSLIYPFRIYKGEQAKVILDNIEKYLVRARGTIRYQGDSYYTTHHLGIRKQEMYKYYGFEAEWTMGYPWKSICHQVLGNEEKAQEYIEHTERVILPDGRLPELYYAGTDKYNGNNPLGWSNALYIIAKEGFAK